MGATDAASINSAVIQERVCDEEIVMAGEHASSPLVQAAEDMVHYGIH